VDVQTGWSAIDVHSKKKFRGSEILDVKFFFKLGLQDKQIVADDNQVINVGVDPCGRLPWLVRSVEHTRVGYGCIEADVLKKCT
jgi:hypothetical protein